LKFFLFSNIFWTIAWVWSPLERKRLDGVCNECVSRAKLSEFHELRSVLSER
jgi:hypothetical protein